MNELPTPIRQEVEEYLRNPPPISEHVNDRVDPKHSDVAEKSFTQVMDHLDESVLNELPPEMRREIAMAQKLRQIESRYPPVGGQRLVPLPATTNPTAREKSNAFNVLMNSPQKLPVVKKSTNPIKKWRTETTLQEEASVGLPQHERRMNSTEHDLQQQPSIAGCSSLSEVRLMLREWIESSDEPNEFDLLLFQNYLIELLNSYNAEMVHQLLTYGLLQLRTVDRTNWNEQFQQIIDAVQERFRRMYGGAKMNLS